MTAPNIIPIPAAPPEPVWSKSKYSNLMRYKDGTYHARAKVCGHLVRQSLKTKSIEIAKGKLDRLLEKERKRLAREGDEMTFGALATEYEKRIEGSALKPRSKLYRKYTLTIIKETWAGIDKLLPHKISEWDLVQWSTPLLKRFSGPVYNGVIQTMRGILQIAMDEGLIAENPAVTRRKHSTSGIPSAPVKSKPVILPEAKQFKELLKRLDAIPRRLASARLVRFLAFGGARISAANQVRPEHVDFVRNEILIPPVKYNDKPIRLPMFKPMRLLMKQCLADYPGFGPLIPIKSPRRALGTACKEVGIVRMNTKALRHLFTTRCLQSGIDVKTVAAWRGDKDGGAMLLRTYAHLLNDHSQKMAKRVRF